MNTLRKLEGVFLERARDARNEPHDNRAYYEGKQKERAWTYERVADELSAEIPKWEALVAGAESVNRTAMFDGNGETVTIEVSAFEKLRTALKEVQ